MDSDALLSNDYNAEYYKTYYQTKKIINLPKGKIGFEIQLINDIPVIVKISNNCKIKNKLHIGDEIYSINGVSLIGISIEDIEFAFYKDIIGCRKCVIYTDYI